MLLPCEGGEPLYAVLFEVAHGGYAEGIGDAVEEGEHGGDVDGFRDLGFGPAVVAKGLDILGCRPVGGFCDLGDVVEEGALGGGEFGVV